jgi:hypothetical protein
MGLTDQAAGDLSPQEEVIRKARQAWEASMLRQLDTLRELLQARQPQQVAHRCGGDYRDGVVTFRYWDERVSVAWPELTVYNLEHRQTCSTFDTAMLFYYLSTADGTSMADRWVSFRELEDGAFYHQAFQGYSGDLLAREFGKQPDSFDQVATAISGAALPGFAPHAFAFQALPRIRLAAVLWPGDEEFPARASILFDGASRHYMTIDGLALLGAGLARRLIRAAHPSD